MRMTMMSVVTTIAVLLLLTSTTTSLVSAQEQQQDGSPCPMEIYVYNDLFTCTDNPTAVVAKALLIADGQCRSVSTSTSVQPTTNPAAYALLPGNYRAQCINSTAVRFIESGCLSNQCNATSLLSGATCDRNNSIAASLYSRLEPPEYLTYPSQDSSYTCIQANGSNVTVSFALFGDCSSPTCSVPTTTPAPIQIQIQPTTSPITITTTPAPAVIDTAPTPTLIIVTPPSTPTVPTLPPPPSSSTTSDAPTINPNENPTLRPDSVDDATPTTTPIITTTTTTARPSSPVAGVPAATTNLTTPTNVVVDSNSSTNDSDDNSTLIAGVASGVAFVAVVLAILLFYNQRKRKHDREIKDASSNQYDYYNKNIVVDPDGFGTGGHTHTSGMGQRVLATTTTGNNTHGVVAAGGSHNHHTTDDSTEQLYANTTNEIWVDPNADDVSTLGGGTLPNEFVHFGQDEPTASVNNDYDYNRNQYRNNTDPEERTQSQFTTSSNPTTFTNYSKLGLLGQATDFAADDDHSFEEQFAELDNDIRSTQKYDNRQQQPNSKNDNTGNIINDGNISNRVKPFEVRAPPGKLGMVVDTPNGGVPVVRAIKADSVLNGSVQIGDRLISVDHVNVTNMSALEVSNLISLKQHQQRLLIFCRLTTSPQ